MARATRYSRGAQHLFVLVMLLLLVLTFACGTDATAATPGSVVINEVAWMGTQASTSDEWIELFNTTDQDIDLTGWTLVALDGTPSITLSGIVPAQGFFLLERTDNDTVSDIAADQIYTGALENDPDAEILLLKDATGNPIDSANGDGGSWPAGNSTTRSTMERINPLLPDSDANWAANNGIVRNGLDADDKPINGTPKAQNSTTIVKINAPPIANAGPDLITNEGVSVTLDGSESYDPDGDALTCTWDPGDGSVTLAGCVVSHAYADIGVFTATLTVDDGHGGIGVDTLTVTVRAPPSKGDANGNGAIDLHDAILCAEIALELRTPTNREEATCDVAAPFGVIDGRDVVRIAEKLP